MAEWMKAIELIKVTDVVIWIIAAACSMNLVIFILLTAGRFLERKMEIMDLDRLLKGTVLYLLLVLPLLAAYILFSLTITDITLLDSEDFPYMIGINNLTLSLWAPGRRFWYFDLAFLAWLSGMFWFGLVRHWQGRRLMKKLEACSEERPDGLFEEIRENMLKGKSGIRLYQNDIIPSPFAGGILTKKIFVPAEGLTEEERLLIYEHELIHCRKNDNLYRQLLSCLCAIYWFNPGIYLLTRYFIEVNEMACDDLVLAGKKGKEKLQYASLLCRISVNDDGLWKNSICLNGFTSSSLERRLKNMKRKGNKKGRWLSVLTAVCFAVLYPAAAYAASSEISKIQDQAAEQLRKENSVEWHMTESPHEEYHAVLDPSQMELIDSITVKPRGGTEVEVSVEAGKTKNLDENYLEEGTKVLVYLSGDPSSQYHAGIVARGGDADFVYAYQGTVNYTFTVKKAGYYSVFIENTGTSTITVTGIVYV